MQYHSDPLLTSTATVILIPCSLSGVIPENGPQADLLARYGEPYRLEFLDDIENELIKVGNPGMYKKGDEDGPIILHIPICDTAGNDLILTDIMSALREAAMFVSGSETLSTIAIGPMGGMYSWETYEGLCERLEMIYNQRGVEFWMYPGDLETETNDETEECLVVVA